MNNGFIETIAFTLWSCLVFIIGWAIGRNEKRRVESTTLSTDLGTTPITNLPKDSKIEWTQADILEIEKLMKLQSGENGVPIWVTSDGKCFIFRDKYEALYHQAKLICQM